MEDVCPVCGAKLNGSHCPRCRGYKCSVCKKPIYRDESYAINGLGRRHVRCVVRPRSRPEYMAAIGGGN